MLERLGLPVGKVSAGPELPAADEVEGCIFSNELIDAFPVRRLRNEGGSLIELRVGLEGERFVDVAAPAPSELSCHFEALGVMPGEGCEAEANLEAAGVAEARGFGAAPGLSADAGLRLRGAQTSMRRGASAARCSPSTGTRRARTRTGGPDGRI